MAWCRYSNKTEGMHFELLMPSLTALQFTNKYTYRSQPSSTMTNTSKLSAGDPTLQMHSHQPVTRSRVCKKWNGSSSS